MLSEAAQVAAKKVAESRCEQRETAWELREASNQSVCLSSLFLHMLLNSSDSAAFLRFFCEFLESNCCQHRVGLHELT